MSSLKDVLSQVSGVSKEEIDERLRTVRDNLKRLDECTGPHDFQPINDRPHPFNSYQCRLCAGTVRPDEYRWYLRGLQHAQKR